MSSRRKILVTGGAGYIGAHTAVVLYQSGFTPIIVDNLSRSNRALLNGIEKIVGEPVEFIEGDCSDVEVNRKIFRRHSDISGVMHFAALKSVGESVQDPLTYYQNNVQSLVALLKAMKEYEIRDIVFSSSCTVYGQPDFVPVGESAAIKRAESPYGVTKQIGERILEDVFKSGFRVVCLRYFNPIGAHPSGHIGELPVGIPNNLVPFITQTASGKRDELTVFGNDYNTPDGSCIRDYVHVMDVASAHVRALDYLANSKEKSILEVFNLGTGAGVSVLDLIKQFVKVSGVDLNYKIGFRRPGDVEKTYADPSKANKVLGWRAELTIEQALRDAWKWELSLAQAKDTRG